MDGDHNNAGVRANDLGIVSVVRRLNNKKRLNCSHIQHTLDDFVSAHFVFWLSFIDPSAAMNPTTSELIYSNVRLNRTKSNIIKIRKIYAGNY